MVTIEIVALVLTGLSITASILYYAMNLRNANKTRELQLKAQEHATETRQAQLLMQIYGSLYSEKAWQNYLEAQYSAEYTDYNDFQEKFGRGNPEFYSKLLSVWWSYNTVGGFLYQGLLDIQKINQLMGTMIVNQWRKWGGIILELRDDVGSATAFINFEYLYNQIMTLRTSDYFNEKVKVVQQVP